MSNFVRSYSFSISFSMRMVARRDSTSAHKHAIHQRPIDDAGEVQGRVSMVERRRRTDWTKDIQPTARRQAWPNANTAQQMIKDVDVGRLCAWEPLSCQYSTDCV